MKYLVPGAAGFIGSKTAELLLSEGHEVVGIDNLNEYYDVRLKKHRLSQLIVREGFNFEQIDIEDREALQKLFAAHHFDAILNLAARAGVQYSMKNPHVYVTTNTVGTLNLLEEMRHRGIPKMVLASTSSLYAGQPLPFHESLPVNTPISPYAASKKAAEVMAYTYHHLYKIDVSVVRYFTVYGPAGRPDMSIFRFIKWIDAGEPVEIFGDGAQSRDFTYVDDIARGTVKALHPVGYEIFNLGGGKSPTTLNNVIEIIERKLNKKANIIKKDFHKTDILETSANISKAKKLLTWEPEVGLEEGLENTIKWYQNNKHFNFHLT
jgi:UDP-glucuronate 4-epimerase